MRSISIGKQVNFEQLKQGKLNIREFHTDIEEAAKSAGFQIHYNGDDGAAALVTLTRRSKRKDPAIYLSAGIHGDETAGRVSLLRLLRNRDFPEDVSWCIFPLLNPEGASRDQRSNAEGRDINRDYRHLSTREARLHAGWLREHRARFDLAICLHEDCDTKGYYIYELNPDDRPSVAEPALASVEPIVGIDPSPIIEGYPCRNGVLYPSLVLDIRPHWPESCYLLAHHSPLVYTFEAPSIMPFESQVDSHLAAVKAAILSLLRNRRSRG